MRSIGYITCLLLAGVVVGCGSGSSKESAAETPLTIEQWKSLPTDQKYAIETFERLKLSDPKLLEQREWDKFMRNVVLPAKKKDGTP